jgi:hypothetical protein
MAWLARFEAGQQPGMMQSIKATPEEAEAARVLINVLLERESSQREDPWNAHVFGPLSSK